MNTKNHLTKNKSTLSFTYVAIIALLLVIIGVIFSCSNSKTNPYDIVKISGETFLCNMSKSYNGYVVLVDSSMSSAMLMEDGDLIGIGLEIFDLYQNSDTKEYIIDVDESEPLLYINGKLASIWISKETNVIPILRQLKDSDIKELRSLVFDGNFPKEYLPFIEKIASINKDIGLDFKNVKKIPPSIIKMFNPPWMSVEIRSHQDFNLLIGLKNTKTLWISLSDTVISEPLPNMPQLEQIILTEVDIQDDIIEDFLSDNPQIKKVVLECDSSSLSMIKNLTNLKSLSIIAESDVLNLEILSTCDQLEVLNLVSGKFENIEVLNELSSLRWLTLPAAITQDEFNSIISNHKDLEVLEMIGCKEVFDLKALTNLESLYGLVITDTLSDIVTPKSLNQLRLLSLPMESFEDTTYITSLKESLPTCTIVPNDGFCLGSGWLFLLFPLIFLFVIRRKKLIFGENV